MDKQCEIASNWAEPGKAEALECFMPLITASIPRTSVSNRRTGSKQSAVVATLDSKVCRQLSVTYRD